jgi:uncharacterized protein YukE
MGTGNAFSASSLSNLILYALLAAVFLYCLVRCVAPLTASRHALARGLRSIRKGEKSRRSWRDEHFLGESMQPGWSAFLANQAYMEENFHGSARVEDYILEDAVCPPERMALAESVPGILMSIGFLGTLVGLWQGLSDAAEIAQTLSAVRQGLMPSIVGGALAVAFILIHRASSSAALSALSAFASAVSRHAGAAPIDPDAQAALAQRVQAEHMGELSRDVSERLAERFAAAMMTALSPLTGEVEAFTQSAARDHVRGVDALVSRFVGLLEERMGDGVEKLALSVDALSKSHQQLQENLRKAAEGMGHASRDMAEAHRLSQDMIEKFDEYLTRLGGAQGMVEEGYARVAANVEHLEIVARQQNNYLLSVGKLQSEWSRALASFQTAADQFARISTDNTQSSAQALTRAAEELQRSSDALVESHQTLSSGVTREIEKAYSGFFQSAGKTSDQLNWLMENIKATLARLPDLLDDTAAIYAGQADRLTDALRSAQAALEDAVDHISAYGGR